jgi:hypothetical protein
MWINLIPWQGRALALLLLALAGIVFGFVAGLRYESNSRDAQDLKTARNGEDRFMRALDVGRKRAADVIEWKSKSDIYYRHWQERLNYETNANLAQCATTDSPTVQLSPVWISLYNAAWMPSLDAQGDSGRAAGEVIEAGTVTPGEALANIGENARLCGEDRKRLDELIDHLKETE